jgi:hypothetical protein
LIHIIPQTGFLDRFNSPHTFINLTYNLSHGWHPFGESGMHHQNGGGGPHPPSLLLH